MDIYNEGGTIIYILMEGTRNGTLDAPFMSTGLLKKPKEFRQLLAVMSLNKVYLLSFSTS